MSGNGPALPCWEDGGSSGPFRGEMGSAREGSIRTAAIIKWPGKIKPGADYGMLSTMDLFPTFASFVGGRMKTDLPIDGIDQSAWLLGKQKKSNRESLITFIGDDPVAVRWRQFRCYSRDFVQKESDSAGVEGTHKNRNDHPIIYNIEADPSEQEDVDPGSGVAGQYMRVIKEYRASLKKHPNTPAASRIEDP
jgi:arylsulfatase